MIDSSAPRSMRWFKLYTRIILPLVIIRTVVGYFLLIDDFNEIKFLPPSFTLYILPLICVDLIHIGLAARTRTLLLEFDRRGWMLNLAFLGLTACGAGINASSMEEDWFSSCTAGFISVFVLVCLPNIVYFWKRKYLFAETMLEDEMNVKISSIVCGVVLTGVISFAICGALTLATYNNYNRVMSDMQSTVAELHQQGYNAGYSDAQLKIDEAKEESYREGRLTGFEAGENEGYQKGYTKGYSEGVTDTIGDFCRIQMMEHYYDSVANRVVCTVKNVSKKPALDYVIVLQFYKGSVPVGNQRTYTIDSSLAAGQVETRRLIPNESIDFDSYTIERLYEPWVMALQTHK